MPDKNGPVLGFDCSGPWCSVAVIRDGTVLSSAHEQMTKGQAERLMPLIIETSARAGTDLADLSAIGVGIGPGNFTGTRIAVAVARGLALSLDIPAIGIGLCEAIALGHPRPCRAVAAARGNEVFWQDFMSETDAAPDDHPSQTDADQLPSGPPVVTLLEPVGVAIAFTAQRRIPFLPQPRPAPIYLRAANAAPPSDLPPPILPE